MMTLNYHVLSGITGDRMLYKIKTIAVYEIECDDHADAIRRYNEGLWDSSDVVDDDAFEVGYTDKKGEYHDITPRR